MVQKEKFVAAFNNLRRGEAMIVKDTIIKRCKWSPQSFSQKMRGVRLLSEYSPKRVNEIKVVETTFRAFNLDAWTGEPIT